MNKFLLKGFKGIRCIPDVHGDIRQFRRCVKEAELKQLFIIQLGDLIDRGPDSPGCLSLMLDVFERGHGLFLKSNHDERLFRFLQGETVRTTSKSLWATLDQINSGQDRDALVSRFVDAYRLAQYWLKIDGHIFVHGAFLPEMLKLSHPEDAGCLALRKLLQAFALFGMVAEYPHQGRFPHRVHDWIHMIPSDITVVVGHDIRSRVEPLTVTGGLGGKAIFLDTGCGKGGRLSWLDIDLIG